MAVYGGQWGPVALLNDDGRPVGGATAYVYEDAGLTTLADLFTDDTKATPQAQPVTADARGNLTFFAEPGPYWLVAVVGGVTQDALAVEVPSDPRESAPDLSGYQLESEKDIAGGYMGLDGSALANPDRLGSGTRDGSKFLRDDGSWSTVAGGAGSSALEVEVYRSTNQTGIAAATYTAVQFNAESYDPNGWHDNASNPSRLTVPSGRDGDYLLVASIGWRQLNDGSQYLVEVYKNGSTTLWRSISLAGAGTAFPNIQVVAPLSGLVAGDYVEVIGRQDDSVARDISLSETHAVLVRVA